MSLKNYCLGYVKPHKRKDLDEENGGLIEDSGWNNLDSLHSLIY